MFEASLIESAKHKGGGGGGGGAAME